MFATRAPLSGTVPHSGRKGGRRSNALPPGGPSLPDPDACRFTLSVIYCWRDPQLPLCRYVALFETGKSRRFSRILRVATRKLVQLDSAQELRDLASPPGNRLEALRGDRAGQHSIRINDQFRLCFVWTPHGPRNVETVDYH